MEMTITEFARLGGKSHSKEHMKMLSKKGVEARRKNRNTKKIKSNRKKVARNRDKITIPSFQ